MKGHRIAGVVLWLLFAVLWAMLARTLSAQTVTQRVSWVQPGATVAEAQALTASFIVDVGQPAPLTHTCTSGGTPVVTTCTAPLVTPLSAGPHTVTLLVANTFGVASATMSGTMPGQPLQFKFVITVTVP